MKRATYLGLLFVTLALAALPLFGASTGHFERTLQVTGPVDLDVTSGSGNITVHTGSSGSVSVSAKIHGNNSWFGGSDVEDRIRRIEKNPPIEQQGNTIHIGRVEDRDLLRNISIDYELTVPAQTKLGSHTGSGDQSINGVQLPLTAKTGSGNVTVENVAGDAQVSSGSGDLKIDGVKGSLHASTGSGTIRAQGIAGEMSASTGSGDVEMHQTAAGDVKASTGSGNVHLFGVNGGLRVSTGSGDIEVEGQATHDWRLGAGSGNLKIRLPKGASFDLDAQTTSGTLNFKHSFSSDVSISKHHIQGKVGSGGVIVNLRTGSGDIMID
jgi:DUF4097 and DUF4098 domain-containing protein YvlB